MELDFIAKNTQSQHPEYGEKLGVESLPCNITKKAIFPCIWVNPSQLLRMAWNTLWEHISYCGMLLVIASGLRSAFKWTEMHDLLPLRKARQEVSNIRRNWVQPNYDSWINWDEFCINILLLEDNQLGMSDGYPSVPLHKGKARQIAGWESSPESHSHCLC